MRAMVQIANTDLRGVPVRASVDAEPAFSAGSLGSIARARPAAGNRAAPTRARRFGWTVARLAFHTYVACSLFSVVGGFLTAPLMTWLFFGDWRFWRHWREGSRLFPHGWRMLWLVLRGEGRFMLGVPLGSAPQRTPDYSRVDFTATWTEGASCGGCKRCCHVKSLRCPVLNTTTGLCDGYDSFYWRYFNCGRYPSTQSELEFYGCPKWRMKGSIGDPMISPDGQSAFAASATIISISGAKP
jgi:hypothetical protein